VSPSVNQRTKRGLASIVLSIFSATNHGHPLISHPPIFAVHETNRRRRPRPISGPRVHPAGRRGAARGGAFGAPRGHCQDREQGPHLPGLPGATPGCRGEEYCKGGGNDPGCEAPAAADWGGGQQEAHAEHVSGRRLLFWSFPELFRFFFLGLVSHVFRIVLLIWCGRQEETHADHEQEIEFSRFPSGCLQLGPPPESCTRYVQREFEDAR
jgi:hypothetical protein